MNVSKLFADEKVNTGRQVELDIAKGLSIIFMIFLHTFYVAGAFSGTFDPNLNFILMNLLGRPYAAVVFMFCMGVGLVYSRHSQWDVMVKRGVKLFLLGLLVNVFEFILPHFVAQAVLGYGTPFPIAGGLLLFCVDILAFAGLSFILLGILKKYEVSNRKLIVLALAMSIVGTMAKGVDFGSPYINLFFANFIGCAGGFTAFPLFNWFIFPVAGYVWGQYSIRATDKNEFFKLWPHMLILALVYFFASSAFWGGILSDDVHFYYFLNTVDAFFCIINCYAVIGMCYWMSKKMPDFIIKIFTTLSSNVNEIYIAQWFLIPLMLIDYHARGIVFNDVTAFIFSVFIIVLATLIALGIKKLKASRS